jgi:hypothetical protein
MEHRNLQIVPRRAIPRTARAPVAAVPMNYQYNENNEEINLVMQELFKVSSCAALNDIYSCSCNNLLRTIKDMEVTERTLGTYIRIRRCELEVCRENVKAREACTHQKYEDELMRRLFLIDEVTNLSEAEALIISNDLSIEQKFKLFDVLGLACNFFPHSSDLNQNDKYVETLIQLDCYDKLPYRYDIIRKVINRCKFMMKEHNILWNLYLRNVYSSYFEIIYDNYEFSNMKVELLEQCNEIFPNFKLTNLLLRGSIDNSIDLGEDINKYKLGFNKPFPCKEIIKERYESFKNENTRNLFIGIQKEKTKNMLSDFGDKLKNKTNLSTLSPLEDFYVHDLLVHKDINDNIYMFTGDDCIGIHSTGRNPYTGLIVSTSFRGKIAEFLHERPGNTYTGTIEDSLKSLYDLPDLNEVIGNNYRVSDTYSVSDTYRIRSPVVIENQRIPDNNQGIIRLIRLYAFCTIVCLITCHSTFGLSGIIFFLSWIIINEFISPLSRQWIYGTHQFDSDDDRWNRIDNLLIKSFWLSETFSLRRYVEHYIPQ